MSKRAISGIKPTGTPHLGNLVGMIQPAIALQESHELFLFVADLHALTTNRNPAELKRSTRVVTATLLAAGLDPSRSVLFRQSDIAEVTELAWHLSCVTGLGLMLRSHAYKAAQEKGEQISFGTFSYPMLMAADIILYDTDVVPVGKDQLQHVEMAQDIVSHFNSAYGSLLKRPEPLVRKEVETIVGTDGRKMSKSYGNTIDVFLPPKKLRKAIMGIVTDSATVAEPKDPENCNVFKLFRAVATPKQVEDMAQKYRDGGFGYGEAKQQLFNVLEDSVAPKRESYCKHLDDSSYLEDVLREGAEKAKRVSSEVLHRVREVVGIV
jgi:tryptophanyl-tRNA synthetase